MEYDNLLHIIGERYKGRFLLELVNNCEMGDWPLYPDDVERYRIGFKGYAEITDRTTNISKKFEFESQEMFFSFEDFKKARADSKRHILGLTSDRIKAVDAYFEDLLKRVADSEFLRLPKIAA